ncbi:unnamed protein product [Brassica rapa]|uniref:Uncharacterized protein n=2 Tax=Brassica TaxID=3705 RepID=A0A8D9GZY5_BRACM|nr:unnamed protein product [Brassica napus]CAG7890131.1 unnamed protein product [Brassica rapa]CDY50275.1 BnaAnng10390D [Brassica napus]
MAMAQIELSDVTAVELVDSLPLERRADPHNLHFSTGRGGDGEDGEARRTEVEPSLALYHTFYRC